MNKISWLQNLYKWLSLLDISYLIANIFWLLNENEPFF